MGWPTDRVFTSVDEFIIWLDRIYGPYISKRIKEVHMHHTWRPNHASQKNNTALQLHKNMRGYHVKTNGWDDIAQHVTVGKNGEIVLGRDIRLMPASAKGFNGSSSSYPFMFEMIGDFDKGQDKLEGKQLYAALAICRYMLSKGKSTRFHREMSSKTCPGNGIDKDWFIGLVKNPSAVIAGVKDKKEEKRMFKPTSTAANEAVIESLKRWADPKKQKNPISQEWVKKAEKGELTLDDAVALPYIAIQRGLK